MRNWIKVVLTSKESILHACTTLDKQIDSAAQEAFRLSGQQAYDIISTLLDKKHDLQCLLLLRESMLNQLNDREILFEKYIEGLVTRDEICDELEIKQKAFRKMLDSLYAKLFKHCIELGYNKVYFERHYSKIGFLWSKYQKLSKTAVMVDDGKM